VQNWNSAKAGKNSRTVKKLIYLYTTYITVHDGFFNVETGNNCRCIYTFWWTRCVTFEVAKNVAYSEDDKNAGPDLQNILRLPYDKIYLKTNLRQNFLR